MNPTSTSGSSAEYSSSKHKNRVQYHDNASCSTSNSNATRDKESHTANSTNNTWYDGHRDHRSDHCKRERSRERDWSRDRKRTADGRARENNFREEEARDEHEQTPTYSSYNYTGTDPSYVDNNPRTLGMMTNISSYGLIAAMNSSQWAMSPLDGMSTNNTVNPTAGMSMNSNIDMNTSGTSMNPFALMSVAGDPNLFGMMGMGNFGQFGMMNNDANMVSTPPKEIKRFSKSVLYPPNPYLPPPTTRDKPPGCKTIFVGGLPEKVTEEVVREVFETCGEILTIRMSKMNFCHIRFASEACIDEALFFSGYRIKIDDKNEPPFVGRFHVDFAQARDDKYEYECHQRSLQREARHRERMEQEYYNPPTPPPVVPFSDHEAAILGEKLRGEDTFQQAIFTLITWLKHGECSKRNAGCFYSMIQSVNSHVHRLMSEKLKYESELNKARMMLRQQMRGIFRQVTEIGKVFTVASLQKVWDHFSKPQRKDIDLWKRQIEKIKNAHVEEVLGDCIVGDMELSGDGDAASEKADTAVMPFFSRRECIEQEYYNPPSPVTFTDCEADILGEKLRGEDTFQQAIFTLVTWLERGECCKGNAGYFYSMIQITKNHFHRLVNEKLKYEDELNKARMMLRQQMRDMLIQFTDIGKVFTAASLQKVWDHFTKPQRKDVDLWKKQTEEIKNAHVEEVLADRIEDDMELIEDGDTALEKADSTEVVTDHFGNKVNALQGINRQKEEAAAAASEKANSSVMVTGYFENKVNALEEINRQKEEIDKLKCLFEASRNEVFFVISQSFQEQQKKDHQIQALRQALQSAHQQLYMHSQEEVKEINRLRELIDKLKCQLKTLEKELSVVKFETNQERERKDSRIQAFEEIHQKFYISSQKRVKKINRLKKEIDKLKCQLENSENEAKEREIKDPQIQVLQNAHQELHMLSQKREQRS